MNLRPSQQMGGYRTVTMKSRSKHGHQMNQQADKDYFLPLSTLSALSPEVKGGRKARCAGERKLRGLEGTGSA